MNILVFGGLGKTAKTIIDLLYAMGQHITIFDLSNDNPYRNNKNIRVINGDICDYDIVNKAMNDIDVIIHLAVNVFNTNDAELTFKTNTFGTYNILQNALINKVPKILIASSAPVHAMDEIIKSKGKNILTDYYCSPGMDFAYDLTKNIQEVITYNFSQTYSMNSLILRLGHIVDGMNKTDIHGNTLSELSYCRGGWVCKYDVARAFLKAIETDFYGYNLINVIGSYQAANLFNLSAAKELINFECNENFLDYIIV